MTCVIYHYFHLFPVSIKSWLSVEIVVGDLRRLFRDRNARWTGEVVSELIPKCAFLFITRVFFYYL
jgi:hypothetical protein